MVGIGIRCSNSTNYITTTWKKYFYIICDIMFFVIAWSCEVRIIQKMIYKPHLCVGLLNFYLKTEHFIKLWGFLFEGNLILMLLFCKPSLITCRAFYFFHFTHWRLLLLCNPICRWSKCLKLFDNSEMLRNPGMGNFHSVFNYSWYACLK